MLCPYCQTHQIIKKGFFFIKHSRSLIRRYFCKSCQKTFSKRTTSITYKQKKPYLNSRLLSLLMSGNTQRRAAKLLNCSKNTAAYKLLWLGKHHVKSARITGEHWQFDEMETLEHTKLKPLTIPLVVNENYQILGIGVGKIKAKGHLSLISQKKYGYRNDEREKVLTEILKDLSKDRFSQPKTITTDSNPLYKKLILDFFPDVQHIQINAGEHIKKKKEQLYLSNQKRIFDPLFIVNQRCAMLRSDLRRLTRRSWCTTKKIQNLEYMLRLYQGFNNQFLTKS